MLIKKREYLPPLAVVCLTVSLLLERLGRGGIFFSPFSEGLFLGLAFAFGMASIIMTAVDRGYE